MSSDESDNLLTPIDYWIKIDRLLGLRIGDVQVQAEESRFVRDKSDVKNISHKRRPRVSSSGKLYKNVKIPRKGAIVYDDSSDEADGNSNSTDIDTGTSRGRRRKVSTRPKLSSKRETAHGKNTFTNPSSKISRKSAKIFRKRAIVYDDSSDEADGNSSSTKTDASRGSKRKVSTRQKLLSQKENAHGKDTFISAGSEESSKSVEIFCKEAIVYNGSSEGKSFLSAGPDLIADDSSTKTSCGRNGKVSTRQKLSPQRDTAHDKKTLTSRPTSSEEIRFDEEKKGLSSAPRNWVKLSRSKKRQNYKYAPIIFSEESDAGKEADSSFAKDVAGNARSTDLPFAAVSNENCRLRGDSKRLGRNIELTDNNFSHKSQIVVESETSENEQNQRHLKRGTRSSVGRNVGDNDEVGNDSTVVELQSNAFDQKSGLRVDSALKQQQRNQPARNIESAKMVSSCSLQRDFVPNPSGKTNSMARKSRLKDLTDLDNTEKLESDAPQEFCSRNQSAGDVECLKHSVPCPRGSKSRDSSSERSQGVMENSSVFSDLLFGSNRVKPPPSRRLPSGLVGNKKPSVNNDTTLLDDSNLWKERERNGE